MPNFTVLQIGDLPAVAKGYLDDRFQVLQVASRPNGIDDAVLAQSDEIRAVVGTGRAHVSGELITALPNLEIISVTAAGMDRIDTKAAAARGIPVANTSRILCDEVADTALWLILGTMRQLVEADWFVRNGDWPAGPYKLGRSIAGAHVGILGLGHIGSALARRLGVMGAELAYTGRAPKPEVSHPFYDTVEKLAEWADILVVSCTASAETRNMVNAEVLRQLGPSGIVVNVARGSVIDEDALIEALRSGEILGAGLDVFENEPTVPSALIENRRTVLLPHIGSATTETRTRMARAMVDALIVHFGAKRRQ